MHSSTDIRQWLGQNDLLQLADLFEQQDISLDVIAQISDEDLQDLKVSLGLRLRFRRAINQSADIKANSTAFSAEAQTTSASKQHFTEVAESRHISVMFCDIVNSSQIVENADPESVREILNEYRKLIKRICHKHAAHIGQFLGDGALIYFGYPKSREDNAERAVRAGLELLQSIRDAQHDGKDVSQLRVGIASGRVVIDELIGDEEFKNVSAVGKIPYLAAKLQQMATAGSVYIDRNTRRLVGDLFTFNFLGDSLVKGFSDEIGVFSVTGIKEINSRFEAQQHSSLAAIIGRDHELASILDRWSQSMEGTGQMVLLTGEPGIGKSRLAWEAIRSIQQLGYHHEIYQCSPFHLHTAFYPFTDKLRHQFEVKAPEHQDSIVSKIAEEFHLNSTSNDSQLSALLSLFNITINQPLKMYPDDSDQQRLHVIDALHRRFANLSRKAPMIVLVEDLHWCDPTTLETINLLLNKIDTIPMLIIATARSEFKYQFSGRSGVTRLTLNRLSRFHIDTVLTGLLDSHDVPRELYEVVSAKTDGVPLFIEELTQSLLESGYIIRNGDSVTFELESDIATIPDTLQMSLMSRIDNLGELKKTAQVAACIGRTFELDTLTHVLQLPVVEVERELNRLSESDLIYPMNLHDSVQYRFKHALVRDVAYDSLLSSERRRNHKLIAAALQVDDHEVQRVAPELLAYHLQCSGDSAAAIDQWKNAAVIAKQRSANAEAVAHLNEAFALLGRLPVSTDTASLELALQLELVAPIRAMKGFAATEVTQVTERALNLADSAQDASGILSVLYTQWVHEFVTGCRLKCYQLAEGILNRGNRDGDDLMCMTGYRALGATCFTQGCFNEAILHFDQSIALYEQSPQSDITQLVGLDSRVVSLGYQSLALWCIGKVSEAHEAISSARVSAEAMSHASTMAFAVYHQTILHGLLEQDAGKLIEGGNTLLTIGEDNLFEMWQVCGRLLIGLGKAFQEETEQSLDNAEQVMIEFEDMGVVYRPAYSAFIALMCCRTNQQARGLKHIDVAMKLIEESGEVWYESVILSVKVKLLQAKNNLSNCRQTADLHSAMEQARSQNAKQLALVIETLHPSS